MEGQTIKIGTFLRSVILSEKARRVYDRPRHQRSQSQQALIRETSQWQVSSLDAGPVVLCFSWSVIALKKSLRCWGRWWSYLHGSVATNNERRYQHEASPRPL